MLSPTTEKNEQSCKETSENIRLIALAKDRAQNGRIGDRALQKLIEQQHQNIKSAVRKRCMLLPFLDPEELEFSAIEGVINRLETYDPYKATFSSWAYFGILNGIDRVVRNTTRNFKAKLEVQYALPAYTEEGYQDLEFLDKVKEHIGLLPESVQEIIALVLQGFRWTEIGQMLKKGEAAVRVAFNRAIERIRQELCPPEPKPKFKLTRRWLCNQLSKVVRKFGGLRIQKSQSYEDTSIMNSVTNQQSESLEHGKIPLSFYQTQEGAKRYKRFQKFTQFRLTPRGQIFIVFLMSATIGVLAHHNPVSAQCAGWLCGARDAILANEMWGAGTPGADVIVNAMFLILQFIAAILVAIPLLVASALGIRREDYQPFFIGSVIIFMALIAINFMVGWLFGV